MRKDLKLGLAVGGVLFGVVLAYVLVFSGGTPDDQQASNPSEQSAPPAGDADGSPRDPIIQTETPTAPLANAAGGNDASPTRAASEADRRMEVSVGGSALVPGTAAQNPAGNSAAETSGAAVAQAAPAPGNAGPWDWRRALEQGASIPAAAHGQAAGTSQAIAAAGNTSVIPVGSPTTQPSSGKRNYIVKSGESFWSIAQREYGNANYLSHIARANPNINAAKLKAGMTIVLPAREDVVPAGAPAVAAAPVSSGPIDPAKEYRVQSGDNLTVIAKRLYGRTSRAAELYELNKELIGPNPSALKKNMVLKLPDAPTASAGIAGVVQ